MYYQVNIDNRDDLLYFFLDDNNPIGRKLSSHFKTYK